MSNDPTKATPTTSPGNVTTDGNPKMRVRYGQITIVYAEELGGATGMWWSPDTRWERWSPPLWPSTTPR